MSQALIGEKCSLVYGQKRKFRRERPQTIQWLVTVTCSKRSYQLLAKVSRDILSLSSVAMTAITDS